MSAKFFLTGSASGYSTAECSRCRRMKRPYSPRNNPAEAEQALLRRLSSRERQLYIRFKPTISWVPAERARPRPLGEGAR